MPGRDAYLDGLLVEPLLSAVTKAKDSPKKPIATPFGELEGKTPGDVARLVIEIFDMLRYVDIERTFGALCQIFLEQDDEETRHRVQNAVENLAQYDLGVWENVGPAVQSALVDAVERMGPADQEAVRPLVVKIWDSALNSEITGTTGRANSVTLSSGSVPVSPEIIRVREKAIAGLFGLFKRATSDAQRRETIHALYEATRSSSGTPSQTTCSSSRLLTGFASSTFSRRRRTVYPMNCGNRWRSSIYLTITAPVN